MAQSSPHVLDVAIGQRIRERRRALSLSQAALADAVEVTFQQIQKYERGANRVSFSRLVAIAQALQCKVGDLTIDLESVENNAELRSLNDLLAVPGALQLLEAYAKLRSRPIQRTIVSHVRALLEAEEGVG